MEGGRLQPSLSAPDLTDLRDARHTKDDGWPNGQDGDFDGNNQLPTPAASRSPTPDLHSQDEEQAFLLRMRSESPEMLLRHRMREARQSMREDSPFTDIDGDTTQRHNHEDDLRMHHSVRQDTPMSMPDSPSSPASPSNVASKLSSLPSRLLPASLWDYLKEEIRATELDGSQEMKAERVTNFFSVPMVVEQVASCLNAPQRNAERPISSSSSVSSSVSILSFTPSPFYHYDSASLCSDYAIIDLFLANGMLQSSCSHAFLANTKTAAGPYPCQQSVTSQSSASL